VAEIYHRSAAGKVTFIDAMTRDEVEAATARAPWEWCETLRGFAPWPPDRVRGEPVIPPSLADTMPAHRVKMWDLAK
jgi:hypothetical protein